MANLSGEDWWRKNQKKYPNSSSLDDLEPGFKSRLEPFIASLKEGGANVVVSSTRRNAIRAHLMHYSWRIAHGDVNPTDVPKKSGLDIEWDHGDDEKSRDAAMEMVKLFHMAHVASLTSNHIAGKAVDMTISWKGELVLTRPSPLMARIESSPRNGDNRELQEIGASVFRVFKLRSDPPHWSHNGK